MSLVLSASLLGSCTTNTGESVPDSLSGAPKHGEPTGDTTSAPTALAGAVGRDRALAYALGNSPLLQSLKAELRALEGETVQAGLRPNPELGVEVEEFGGEGGSRGFNGAEITSGLSQTLELAGKRPKRRRAAELAAESLRAEILGEEREVEIAVGRAFATLLEAQEIRRTSAENLARTREQLGALESMLEAGASTRIDVNRARLAVSEAHESLHEAQATEKSAAADLGRLWGGGDADLRASGSLAAVPPVPSLSDPEAVIARHPAMQAADLQIEQREAVLALERARRISNIEVGAGVRESRGPGETSAVAGVSVPLPVFDRNQGNIRAAAERVSRARAERRSTESELRARLARLAADMRSAQSRVNDFDSQTVAAARQALDDTETAYTQGKKSLLEFLDARETLFEIQQRQIRAQADLLRARLSIQGLARP